MPPDDARVLAAILRRWMLVLGVAQVTLGCAVGLVPPTAVAWYRGLVMAHLEFTANGVLLVVLGLLAAELRLPARAMWAWFLALQGGAWLNGGAGLVAAFGGASSPFLPAANQASPPPGGTASPVVSAMLVATGVLVLAGLLLTLAGLLRARLPMERAPAAPPPAPGGHYPVTIDRKIPR